MAKVLSAVSERRLRPIYEQLDNGNNKKAFHEADKVLKKQKDLTAAKVLKTIAMHRMGKVDEAFALSQEVVAVEPTDDNSLQGLSLYYKEIGKTELICLIYENAVKHCPGNEEYNTHLFMSYVRHENFQKMQRVAMSLYKQHSKNPYLFWGIMAIVLQAQNASDEKLAKTMYLPLAEKMIEKHIEKGKIEAEAEVRLYLLILDLIGKHEKALEVLQGPLGKKLTAELRGLDSAVLKAKEKTKRWSEVNVEHKRLLKENSDVWNYAVGYLDSFFHLLDQNLKPEEDLSTGAENSSVIRPDYTLPQAFEFILSLVNAENEVMQHKKRGPYLLRLEMLKRLKARNDESQDKINRLGSPWQLLLEYALDFSTKPCCFHDLVPYFCLLASKDIDKFLADLYEQQATFTYCEMNGECSESLKREINRRKEKEIQRHIFTIEATRFLGKHESLWNEEKVTLAVDYLQRHRNGVRFSSDRPSTDGCVVDSYCLFAVRLLLDIYLDTEDTALLWRCASILEYGLAHSHYNYEMKFMLIRIYCRLGLLTPCRELFDSLEIKHMQHDTLGHVISQHVVSLGHFHVASRFFQIAKNFYTSNNKESLECLIACFRNGTFYKVSELVEYKRSVNNSIHAALVKAEHMWLDLLVQGDIDQPVSELLLIDFPPIDYDSLTDNRDFSFNTDINPENKRLTQELIDENFAEEKKWLLFRDLLIRCVRSILAQEKSESTPEKSSQPNGHPTEKVDSSDFDSLCAKYEAFCEEPPKEPPAYLFHGPHPSRLNLCDELHYPQTMLLLFKYYQNLWKARSSASSASEQDCFTHYLSTVISNISEVLKSCCSGILVEPKSDDYSNEEENSDGRHKTILSEPIPDVLLCIKPCVVERLVLCTEMFSVCVLLLTSMRSIVTEAKAEIQRRRRKKKGKHSNDTMPEWVKGYQDAIASLRSFGSRLTSAVNQLKLDADTMRLDLAKSILVDKKTSATPDRSEDQCASQLCEDNKRLETGDSLLETKDLLREEDPTVADQAHDSKISKLDSEKKTEILSETETTNEATSENLSNPSSTETSTSQEPVKETSPAGTQDNADVNGAAESLKKLNVKEDPNPARTLQKTWSDATTEAKFDKMIKSASESLATSCEQMMAVIEGRMKRIKDFKI